MTYLFAAYTVIWAIIFGYTLLIGKRQRDLEKDIIHIKSLVSFK
ncbi:MAG: CcmD family protein [Clostridia bacterium]|nr:CcmD family protein [Clostridia bacterium]